MNLADVFLPLRLLRLDYVIRNMGPQSSLDELVFLECADRVTQIAWQVLDAESETFSLAHTEDVLVHRGAGVELSSNSIKPRLNDGCHAQVRVARRVRKPQLAQAALAAPSREPHEGTPVYLGPCDMGGRFKVWHQSLIGVY